MLSMDEEEKKEDRRERSKREFRKKFHFLDFRRKRRKKKEKRMASYSGQLVRDNFEYWNKYLRFHFSGIEK